MKNEQEKRERKRTVYDGLDIGVRGLTLIILLGLLLLAAVMGYAYWEGNLREYREGEAMISAIVLPNEKIDKINQKLIDNREKPYYNNTIAVA